MVKTLLKAAGGFGIVTAPSAVLAFLPSTEWVGKEQARLFTILAGAWFVGSLLVLGFIVVWDRRRKASPPGTLIPPPGPASQPVLEHPLNDFIDAREDGRKLRGRLAGPWDEALRQDAQTFFNRCRALGRKWPEHRVALDRALDRPLAAPLRPDASTPTNAEILDALQVSTFNRIQAVLVALDRIISPPTPISDAEFVRQCNQYVFIGGQVTRRVRQTALDAPESEWSDLLRRVREYVNEVYGFFHQHRPKYWLHMAEFSSDPAEPRHVELRIEEGHLLPTLAELHPGGYADMLCGQIDRAVRTLREAVDES